MISVKHLTKCYGEFTAVDDLSFEIDEGHVYGFLGPNGAGKSTTMNIITGCLSATSGQVTIDGHDIFEEPKEAKRAIGYLPEIPPLYTNETPEEYLKFVAEAKGLKGKEMARQIEGVISQTRIQNVRKRLISKLSKLLRCFKSCRCVFLYRHSGSGRFLRDLGLHLCLVILQALVKVSQLGRFRQVILALVEQRAAVLHIGHNSVVMGSLFRRNVLSLPQSGGGCPLHGRKIAMLFEVRDKLGQYHLPLCLVLLPRFRAFVVQHKILPIFIFSVVFVVVLDMLNQRALSVTKILPPLVVVRLAVHSKVNAEGCFVVPAARVAVLFPVSVLGGVQFFKNTICHG